MTVITRDQAVTYARTWINTPYVKGARIRGAGCDCATLLAEYLIAIGASHREDLGVYSHDWFANTTEERYMYALMKYAAKTVEGVAFGTPAAQPGDLVLFRVARSRVFNHGAIVTNWPKAIHAAGAKVSETDVTQNPLTTHMEMAIFNPWEKPVANR
jgi:cell wall-associated NlpC family hydrolase